MSDLAPDLLPYATWKGYLARALVEWLKHEAVTLEKSKKLSRSPERLCRNLEKVLRRNRFFPCGCTALVKSKAGLTEIASPESGNYAIEPVTLIGRTRFLSNHVYGCYHDCKS